MRKTNALVLATTLICIVMMCSYVNGPATHGWDCTGAETDSSNPKGCSTGSGCHSTAATAGIVVTLELDSAGVAVTSYKGGQVYTIQITGTNTTTNNLPKFGFQVAAIKGAVSLASPTNAGTFQQTGLPAGIHYQTPTNLSYLVADIIEHTEALSPDSGTGGAGTIYKESFTWTAPVSGTGTVSFWGVLNAVNNNGSADAGDLWNTQNLVITEDSSTTVNSIAHVAANLDVTIYPNPLADVAQIVLDNVESGFYTLAVYNEVGKEISIRQLMVSSGSFTTNLNTSGWATGIYLVRLSKDTEQKVVKVVKQ